MAVAMATEIGKQVPVKQVYEDAGSPAVRQVGATLEDVVKCIRLVGFPIQWLAVQQDRFRDFIEKSKDRVPPERLVLPPAQILGPVLEGIRYHLDDNPIREAFSRLLSRAMDSDRANEAHPSFASIINRLSPDEALILQYLCKNGPLQILGDAEGGIVSTYKQGSLPKELNVNTGLVLLYIDNLRSCGLLGTVYKGAITRSGAVNLTPGYGIPAGQRALVISLTPLEGPS
ncbi:DUF4393 domain-containing protein [Methylobacterium sp. NMS12]|uniref:DUF4393 domain-containing protein n=1 Tax=Methylobacterium sp. NMS12 TaxID=3079766 RepID=UPI003F883EF8